MCCINPHWALEAGKRLINVNERAARVRHSTREKEKGRERELYGGVTCVHTK